MRILTICGPDDCDHNDNLNSLFNAAKCKGLSFNKSKYLFSRPEIDLLGYRVLNHKIHPNPGRLCPLTLT